MSEAEVRRRKVLYDEPVEQDAFSGRGHQKTAESLARTIEEFAGDARSIGLEGRWGAGKSTIVELAKQVLNGKVEDREYCVFTFDLWTNQNTNFRRTFLESFLTWMEGISTSRSEAVAELWDKIRDKTIETKTVNVKSFSAYGLVVVAFLLVLPWLYMWLSPFAMRPEQPLSPMTATAVTLIALMGLMTVGATANSYRRTKKRGNRYADFVAALSDTLSVFSKDAQTVKTKQNIREADPTQDEFRNILNEILALSRSETRRIIVVFDNIDRISSDRISEAWSDIRSVVSSRGAGKSTVAQLTVIVPYDREHIIQAVHGGGTASRVHQEDIFRKSFDAIFFVAPPIISDSVAFFASKLEYALGAAFENDAAYRVFRIFNLSRGAEPTTPRQVISFINSITTLWEQWGDVIELPTLAIFVLHRDKFSNSPGLLRDINSVDVRYREMSGDVDLFKNLAALSFNVPPAFALQVLLHGKIEQIFTSDDDVAVREISTSPGFGMIVVDVFEESAQRWAAESPTQFMFAAKNLAALGSDRPETSHCGSPMLEAVDQLQPTPPTEWGALTELVALYRLCGPREAGELTSHLTDWLSRSLPEKESDRTLNQGQAWVAFMIAAFEALKAIVGKSEAKVVLRKVAIPRGNNFVLGAAFEAEGNPLHLNFFANHDQLFGAGMADTMLETVSSEPHVFFHAWRETRNSWSELQATDFLSALSAKLIAGENLSADDIQYLIASLNRVLEAVSGSVGGRIRKAVVESGVLYHAIHKAAQSEGEVGNEVIAEALWMILLHCGRGRLPAAQNHPVFGDLQVARETTQHFVSLDTVREGVVQELVAMTGGLKKIDVWIKMAAEDPNEKPDLLQMVIVECAMKGHVPHLSVVAENYSLLREYLGENIGRLLDAMGSSKSRNAPELDFASLPVELLEDVAPRTELGWIEFLRKVDDWLRSLDADAWRDALSNGGRAVLLLQVRVRNSGLTLEPSVLRVPLAKHVLAQFEGQALSVDGMDQVVMALPPNNRVGLAADVLDLLAQSSVTAEGFDAVTRSYPKLLGDLDFASRADVTVSKVVIPALQSGTELAIEFLKQHGKVFRKVLTRASESLVGQVEEFIGSGSDMDDETAIQKRRELRDLLGLEKAARDRPKASHGS